MSGRDKHHKYFQREMVTSPKFDATGSQSLSKYLRSFERYFKAKYDGTQRECAQQLAGFLGGECKEAYDALGGSTKKYGKLKSGMLQWYKS